jgi:hypothetical protein
MLRDAEIASEQSLRSGGAEANDCFGFDGGDLSVKPGAACGNLGRTWFFVDTTLAARLPLEMFYGVGDVDLRAVDAGFDEGRIEQFACGANEWLAFEVFLIAGLLADQQDFGIGRAFAEDGLRAAFPEVAGFARFGGLAEVVEVEGGVGRKEGGGWILRRLPLRHIHSMLWKLAWVYGMTKRNCERNFQVRLAHRFLCSRANLRPAALGGLRDFCASGG